MNRFIFTIIFTIGCGEPLTQALAYQESETSTSESSEKPPEDTDSATSTSGPTGLLEDSGSDTELGGASTETTEGAFQEGTSSSDGGDNLTEDSGSSEESSSSGDPLAVCGDGQVEGSEDCDGNNFQGTSCASLGLGAGTLECQPDCTIDTTGCFACVPSGAYCEFYNEDPFDSNCCSGWCQVGICVP